MGTGSPLGEWGVTAHGDRVSFGADEHNGNLGDGGTVLERS